MVLIMPKKQPLVIDVNESLEAQLDSKRPDKPSCQSLKAADAICDYLSGIDEETGNLRATELAKAYYEERKKNPRLINLKELKDAVTTGHESSGPTMADLFAAMEQKPSDIVVIGGNPK